LIYSRAHRADATIASPPPQRPLELLPAALTDGSTFDYIVVGAGSAGCALVDRILSGTTSTRVLLLEAGPTNEVPEIQDFRQAMSLRGTVYDWNDTSQPQNCMDGETVAYDAGHVNGGGSSINGMVWVRGNPGDYDNWADTGCVGWDYASVLPVFERQEAFKGIGGGPTRGTSGPVQTTNLISVNDVSKDFIQSMAEMGYQYNPDYNSGDQDGVAYSELNVVLTEPPIYGIRQDAFNAFVRPHCGDSRLTAVPGARVQQLQIDDELNATGVSFSYNNQTYSANADQDIIVCAGALRSPQILMLSGIGDPDQLKALGIPVVLAQPAVGQNLQDQLIPFVVWGMKKTDPDHFSVMDNNVFAGNDGPYGAPTFEIQTFYMVGNPGFPPYSFGVGAIVLHPSSRGQITLASANYLDPPLIQPNLLCDPADVTVSLDGLKLARTIANEFAGTSSWLDTEVAPGPNVVTDAQLIAYMKQTAVPDFHYVGTCKMGTDSASVVDATCRVYGVGGLRVADASIMPFVTSGNTNAPSMMIGGRCGDFIVDGTPPPSAAPRRHSERA
jgi:choline dehydrogenase